MSDDAVLIGIRRRDAVYGDDVKYHAQAVIDRRTLLRRLDEMTAERDALREHVKHLREALGFDSK